MDWSKKKHGYTELILRGVKAFEAGTNLVLFIFCWACFYQGGTRRNLSFLLIAGYAVFFTWVARIYNSYHIDSLRISEVIYSLSLATILSNTLVYFGIASVRLKWVNPLALIGLTCVQVLFNSLWALGANKIYFKLVKPKSSIVIYRNEYDLKKMNEIVNLSKRYSIDRYVKGPNEIKPLIDEIEGHEAVFVAGVPATLRNGIAKYCVEKDLELYAIPHVGDIIMAGAQHMQMYSIPVIRVLRSKPIPEYMFLKRLFDIIISLSALILLSPIMLITAVAIKLQDGGPVIYRQKRLTKDRREFEILKFRSMVVSAEGDGQARLASKHDDRITPVGRFIRACRIDELPQLINILKGDMSIVGPRPERPEIAEHYEREIPAFALRLQVKAGLTGLAQVYGRYSSTPYEKLQMDLMYINKISPLEDIRLMFATVKVLFQKESTEGFEVGPLEEKEQEVLKEIDDEDNN